MYRVHFPNRDISQGGRKGRPYHTTNQPALPVQGRGNPWLRASTTVPYIMSHGILHYFQRQFAIAHIDLHR